MSFDSYIFERHIEEIEMAISYMTISLKKYATKEYAKQDEIDKRNNTLATLHQGMQAAREYMAIRETELQKAFDRGKEVGKRETETEFLNDMKRPSPVLIDKLFSIKEGRLSIECRKYKFFDDQALRMYSIERAMRAQPELFKRDEQTSLFK